MDTENAVLLQFRAVATLLPTSLQVTPGLQTQVATDCQIIMTFAIEYISHW